MSLIIATGSNIGDQIANLKLAEEYLKKFFKLKSISRYYSSKAVGITDQPDFINQVLEFELPTIDCHEALRIVLDIEKKMGRVREIKWGPRIIDIDIIFWNLQNIESEELVIPHPFWKERSFVVRPLTELPFFTSISKIFDIPVTFETEAHPLIFKEEKL